MKTMQFLKLVTIVALFAGCAAATPHELIDARSAYKQASEGPAKQLAPAELHKAQKALALAEQSFQHEPGSTKGKWYQIKGRRKHAWGELTDDDFKKAEGSVDRLYGVIQEKFGDTKEAIQAKLDKLHLK